jgi:hypothetical protein
MSQQLNGIHQTIHLVSSYSNREQPATLMKTYSEPIFNKRQSLTLAIDKGHLDIHLPIFTFDSTPNAYSVQMEYDGVISDLTPVVFISTHPSLPTTNMYYWYVWTINLWLYMVNTTLKTCFTNLASKITLPTGSKEPYFDFNSGSRNISLYAQKNYYATYELSKPIKIYMNTKLWKFFEGMPVEIYEGFSTFTSPTQRDVLFLIVDVKNNYATISGETYYYTVSDNGYELIASWFDAVGIYITSNTLHTRNEIAAVPSIYGIGSNVTNTKTELPIIYHYNFQYQGYRPLFIDFLTNGTYKIIDLEMVDEIRRIELNIYWFDKFGNSYQLFMYPGDAFNISLIFQEKK